MHEQPGEIGPILAKARSAIVEGGLTEPEANPEGRALVDEIRSAIVDVFAEFGAASNQIGKTYPMLASLNPETRAVLSALKAELDPDELVNPGALGDFST